MTVNLKIKALYSWRFYGTLNVAYYNHKHKHGHKHGDTEAANEIEKAILKSGGYYEVRSYR
jgi:hypothetical protein